MSRVIVYFVEIKLKILSLCISRIRFIENLVLVLVHGKSVNLLRFYG